MAIAEFKNILANDNWELTTPQEQNLPRVFSSLKVLSRYVMRKALRAMRSA